MQLLFNKFYKWLIVVLIEFLLIFTLYQRAKQTKIFFCVQNSDTRLFKKDM